MVEGRIDICGMYGVDPEVPAGHSGFRYTLTVISAAPADRLDELFRAVDGHSPVLDDLRRAIPVSGELRIAGPAAVAGSAPA